MTPAASLCPWVRDPTAPGALSNAARIAARWALVYAPEALSAYERSAMIDALRARRIAPDFAIRLLQLANMARARRERGT